MRPPRRPEREADLLRLNPRVIPGDPPTVKLHRLDGAEIRELLGRFPAAGTEGSSVLLRGTRRELEGGCPSGLRPAVSAALDAWERRTFQWRCGGGTTLALGDRTLLMGVLNVTPDSFSDGGRFRSPEEAVEAGVRLAAEGADVVDVGGESTRPGSDPVPAAEEIRRVLPVVEGLAARGVCVSIDTSKATVAEAALRSGARIVNDVTALGDSGMARAAADAGAGLVLMHMQGTPKSMQRDPVYGDMIEEITRLLRERAQLALEAGVAREAIMIDPGIGFGKRLEENFEILRRLREFRSLGFPILVGPSRKSFLGAVLDGRPPAERLYGTVAAVAACVLHGAHAVRVHDVAACRDAVRVLDRVRTGP